MSTNTVYAKGLLLVRFRNIYWVTIYMNAARYTKKKISLVIKNKICFISR